MATPETSLLVDDQTPADLVSEYAAWFTANTSYRTRVIHFNETGLLTVSEKPEVIISLLKGTQNYPQSLNGLILEVDSQNYLDSLRKGILPDNLHSETTLIIQLNEVFNCVRSEVSSGRFRLTNYAGTRNAQQIFYQVLILIKETLDRISNGSFKPLSSLPVIPDNKLKSDTKISHYLNTLFSAYKWNIGIIHQPIHEVAFSSKRLDVEWLDEAPGNDFRADPFGYIHMGNEYLLYEYYDYKRKKGYLRKRDESGDHFYMESPSHLSYPYIFQAQGRLYLTPESAAAGTINLYSIDNNTPTAKHGVLEAEAVDPTIFHYNNQWWLFFTDKKRQGADLKLHIYFSPYPEGPWRPHANNPVKTDICTARPGGTPFMHNGKLYRPVQDSSGGYGSALFIMEITKLTTEIFEEIPVNRITPDMLTGPYKEGVHTLSPLGNKTLIDAKRKKRTLQPFLHYIVK